MTDADKITIERETLERLVRWIGGSRAIIETDLFNDLRAALAALAAEPDEIEQLRADLISCRGTVKTELNHYERLAGVHGKTPHGAAYEAEAQRLDALLDRIDAMMKDKP